MLTFYSDQWGFVEKLSAQPRRETVCKNSNWSLFFFFGREGLNKLEKHCTKKVEVKNIYED